MSNRLPKEVSPSFQFDDEDEDELRRAKKICHQADFKRMTDKSRREGLKSRGIRFTDADYQRLEEGRKETNLGSLGRFIVHLMDERDNFKDCRKILKGVDRRLMDLELHLKEELRSFRASFEVSE